MGALESRGTNFWFSVGGWVALAALLGVIVRTMRKATPSGHPQLVEEFREVWNRRGERFSLHADLPRLSRKVFIHTKDNQTMEPPNSAIAAIKQVILGLSEQLYDWSPKSPHTSANIKAALDESFPDEQEEHADLQLAVKSFLENNADLLDVQLMGLLKTLTQDIVAPGVIKMKRQLTAQLPYKDKRGEWYIHISFRDDDTIMVSHQKREQSFGHAEGQDFEFQWNLDLIFDRNVSCIMASALYIPVIDFNPAASEDTKSRVLLLLDDYTRL